MSADMPWLSATTVAALLGGVTDRRVRQMIDEGKLEARRSKRGCNANAYDVSLVSLPPDARAKYLEQHPELQQLAPVVDLQTDPPARSYIEAPESVRQRAELRLQAVHGRDQAIRSMEKNERISDVEREFVSKFHEQHPAMKISVKSVRRWAEAFRAGGIDALVDGNDGSARKGHFAIPREAQHFFFQAYLDPKRALTVKAAILETRAMAFKEDWTLPRRDDPFYRYARSLSNLYKALRKASVDEPETVLDSVLRGMEQPMRTLESDHHLVDVFVSCEGTVCGPEGCRNGHRPWWTPMMDVGSRKIVSYQISLEVPNSQRILEAFRLAVEKEGLPVQFYCDNGKDFKKATGKGLSPEDRSYLDNRFRALGVRVIWAKPYNAQAKSIERLFGTFVKQHWIAFESYVGRTGQRSEHADFLYNHPEQLPTFVEFCAELEARVDAYNRSQHRGIGMNNRTPAEIFAQQRMARRDPDPAAFALVFYRCETRVLDRHGIRVDNTLYRLIDPDASVTVQYQSERVKILIDPSDISRAVVCSIDERFLCSAVVRELATHDATDAVTQSEIERVARHRKNVRKRVAAGDVAALRHLNWLKQPGNRLRLMREIATSRRAQESEIVAKTGTEAAATVVLPRFSSIARDAAAASEPRSSLSAADREIAASVPPITDAQLDQLLAEERGYLSAPRLRAIDDDVDIDAELARIARLRKEKAGLCLVEGCEEPRTSVIDSVDECGRHWLEIHGQQLAKDLGGITLEQLRRDIEKEACE